MVVKRQEGQVQTIQHLVYILSYRKENMVAIYSNYTILGLYGKEEIGTLFQLAPGHCGHFLPARRDNQQ